MTVISTGFWTCVPRAARPERQYSRLLPLYSSVEFNHAYCTEALPLFTSWNFTEGDLPRKQCTFSVLFQVIAEVETK